MAQTTKGKRAKKALKARARPKERPTPDVALLRERELVELIMDPCRAKLTGGFGLGTTGIVQRFSKFYTVPFNSLATPTGDLCFTVEPNKGGTGVTISQFGWNGSPPWQFQDVYNSLPHTTFCQANADSVSVLACCVEVYYTGKVVDRAGYAGVLQTKQTSILDMVTPYGGGAKADPDQRMAMCQATGVIAQEAMSVKWIPTVGTLTSSSFPESDTGVAADDLKNSNAILIQLRGVTDPLKFTLRVTTVVEYIPKASTYQTAPRPTQTVPAGAPQRIATHLDRAGDWWHSVGMLAESGMQFTTKAVYGASQAARLGKGLLKAAPALLALVG